MIRTYNEREDKKKLLTFIKKSGVEDNVGSLDELTSKSNRLLLYECNGLRGYSYASISPNEEESITEIITYVEPKYRLKGIGTALYKEIEKLVSETKPDFLCTYIGIESGNPVGFAKKMGYEKWWGSPELVYTGGYFPKTDIEFVKYEDQFFKRFVKVVQDSYYDLHRKNDLKPYITSEKTVKQYKLNNKDKIYLILDNDQIVASVTTGEGEVDNLMVAPRYQGKGYGRKALQFGINKMLNEGYKDIRICFVEGNDNAKKLYISLGFKPLHYTQVYRKFL
ncbi:GNAT family N-acetyltransferase [Guptibacillus hwajinpoensis]|uniref:N-acetyltransferase domain-containing protein n=1 Tax=Guptibacillus hwajinpoensis TaxID=208199 RepID=A0A0J6FVU0_9BACL|nr:GNAT family N-acetyltransferase [Alkalihalobacillus macyae]KMM38487.1 hypothetical protein AB986_04095 [Alkalihalobacillus macyae]